MARVALNGIDVSINGAAQRTSTTIGAIGGYALVLATAVPDRGITLTSSYLSAMVGDIAVSHLLSAPDDAPRIEQRVLTRDSAGQTHAQTCLLDHSAELQARLAEHVDELVAIQLSTTALESADAAWQPEQPT